MARKLTEEEIIEKTRQQIGVMMRRLEKLGHVGAQQNKGTELYNLYHCLLDAKTCLLRMEAREEMTWDQ